MKERLLWGLALVIVATAFISPAVRDLYAGDESAYARIVAEMRSGGDLLLLRLGGEPYTDKPPIHFWIVLVLTRILGAGSTWAYVLPSLVSYAALVVLVGWLGARWMGRRSGGWAAFLAATSILLWGSGQTARMDAAFALAITVAVALVHEGLERRRGGLLAAAGLATSVATMIKGPAALAIVFLVWAYEAIRLRRSGGRAAALALLAAAALPLAWIQALAVREGGWLAFDLLVTQNLGRSIDSFAHAQPPWYFVQRFPLLFFPWFVLLLFALVHGIRRRGETAGFLSAWFLAVFLLFSLVSGKLDVYLLPAVAPGALLIAAWLGEGSGRSKRFAAGAHLAIVATLAVVAAIAAVLGPARLTDEPEATILASYPVAALMAAGAALFAVAAAAHLVRPRLELERSIVALGLSLYVTVAVAAPWFSRYFNQVNSSRPVVAALRSLGVEGETLVHYQAFFPWGRDFDFGDPRIRKANPWTLKRVAAGELPVVVITRDSRTTELGKPLRERYEKRASARVRRKNYDVWVLRDFTPRGPRAASEAASAALPARPRVFPRER